MSSTSVTTPTFSIIVPTRGRTEGLRRLLDSFKATTANLSAVEIILVVDSDDKPTLEFAYDGLSLKRVVVEAGRTMGELNMAGYEVSTGDYVMLLNDDVIVRTQGWDEKVLAAFRAFHDGIVLVHVNDKIFEYKLCTFPFLSRKYCELAGGICPQDYVRYRIDDHIYNVFNLLAVLGKIRVLYLPDVVFEHTNYVLTALGAAEYRPDEKIHEIDTRQFDNLLPSRKQLALQLIDYMEDQSNEQQRCVRQRRLDQVTDSVALRRPEYVRFWSDGDSLSSDNVRVTIGIVSANVRADHARTCIDLVKKFTKNFELIILDNNGRTSFNHPHEMNKLLSICDTDYLVLMDDDVFVEPGWLDGMLRCMTPRVGVVTPLHKDRTGQLSYAGVVMRPDYSGHHLHSLAIPDRPARIQTLCSAIMLIDMSKCGSIHFDESYSKYFLDIDYGFRVWSAGYEVVCSPYVSVTHIGGATLQQGSPRSEELFEIQRQHFVRQWVDSGRYRQVEENVWSKIPEIVALLNLPLELDKLINQKTSDDCESFRKRALGFFRHLKKSPALWQWAAERVWQIAGHDRPLTVDDPVLGRLGFLLGCTQYPILVESNVKGLNIVLYDAEFFAIPQAEGEFDYERVKSWDYSQIYRSENVDVLRVRIHAEVSDVPVGNMVLETGRNRVGALIESWYLLKTEAARFGSWKPALRLVAKRFLKKQIISLFGIGGFYRFKSFYSQVKAEKYRRQSWLVASWFAMMLIFSRGITKPSNKD